MKTPLFPPATPFACVLDSWRAHEAELRGYLLHRLSDPHLADDLVQEVFLKAMRYGNGFCVLDNPRAWLFQVARNTLVDRLRLEKNTVPLPEDFPENLLEENHPIAPVDALAECLARALSGLSVQDSDILHQCDIEGVRQQAYADAHGLSLPAVKSRLLRARQRMRDYLIDNCGVRFDAAGKVCCHAPAAHASKPSQPPPTSGPA